MTNNLPCNLLLKSIKYVNITVLLCHVNPTKTDKHIADICPQPISTFRNAISLPTYNNNLTYIETSKYINQSI